MIVIVKYITAINAVGIITGSRWLTSLLKDMYARLSTHSPNNVAQNIIALNGIFFFIKERLNNKK